MGLVASNLITTTTTTIINDDDNNNNNTVGDTNIKFQFGFLFCHEKPESICQFLRLIIQNKDPEYLICFHKLVLVLPFPTCIKVSIEEMVFYCFQQRHHSITGKQGIHFDLTTRQFNGHSSVPATKCHYGSSLLSFSSQR